MKSSVRLLAAILGAAALVSACSSGGGAGSSSSASASSAAGSAADASGAGEWPRDPNVNPAGVYPICKEAITLKVGIPQSTNVEDYATNALTQWYEEQGNFKLDFEFFPAKSTDALQKLEVMVASGGELPEVLVGFDLKEEAILNYGEQGVAFPLSDYYEHDAFYINEGLENAANKDLKKWLTSADGNIYYVGKYSEQYGNMYSLRTYINQSWLDKLGLKMPETTDEFRDVLKAFLEKDPNGNGQKDEIGLVGGSGWRQQVADFLMNAFIYDDVDQRWTLRDGKLDVAYNKDEWRAGLRYLHQLVSEGLLSPQSFTMDQAQLRQTIENGEASQVGSFTAGNPGGVFGATNERKLEYAALTPLKGPEGVQYTPYYPVIPDKYFVITRDCKNPEAAFRWADLTWSLEGTLRGRWGVPGTDWLEPGPEDKSMLDSIGVKAMMIPVLPWGAVQNSHWVFQTPGCAYLGVTDGQVAPADDPLYSELWIRPVVPQYMDKAPAQRVENIQYTMDETDDIKEIKTTLKTYVEESMARFATGDMDIESEWDSYCKELDNIGLAHYIEVSQAAYDRTMGK